MEKFRFKVFDYKKFFLGMKSFLLIMLPVIFISFFIIHDHQDIVFVSVSLISVAIIAIIYFYMIDRSLVHDSEIILSLDGIFEKNLKTKKEFSAAWGEIEEWKLSIAKPSTHEIKRYITIRFKNTKHTISVSEDKSDAKQLEMFKNFLDKMKEYALSTFKDKLNEEH